MRPKPTQRGLFRLACALLLVTLAGATVRPRSHSIIPLTDKRFEWTRARLPTASFPAPPEMAKADGPKWDELLTASSTKDQPGTAPAALNEEPSLQTQLSEGVDDELKAKLAHREKSQARREASEAGWSCWHSDFTDDMEDLEHEVTQLEARSKKRETQRITTRKQPIKEAYEATDEDACADSPDPKGCAKAHQQIKWRSLQDKYECAAYTDIVNKDHTKDKNSDADHAGLPSRSRSPFLIPDDDS
jgi:hypothetical protein